MYNITFSLLIEVTDLMLVMQLVGEVWEKLFQLYILTCIHLKWPSIE